MINDLEPWALNCIKTNEVNGGEASITDNNENSIIEASLPAIVHTDDEVLKFEQVPQLLDLVGFALFLFFLFLNPIIVVP